MNAKILTIFDGPAAGQKLRTKRKIEEDERWPVCCLVAINGVEHLQHLCYRRHGKQLDYDDEGTAVLEARMRERAWWN